MPYPPHLLKHDNRHVSGNHLDIGVGTGYFLDHCQFPTKTPRLGLLDLNPTCLEMALKRLARFQPTIFRANALEPIHLDAPRFDSIALNYLLHCLPGTIHTKAVALEQVQKVLNPGGVVFGSTLLQGGVERNWMARQLMKAYNAKKIFSHTSHDLDGLQQVLQNHFSEYAVEVRGCAALFSGRTSRNSKD